MLQGQLLAAALALGASTVLAAPLVRRGQNSGKLTDDPNYTYVGCYNDNNSRSLEHQLADVGSVGECLAAAKAAGYKYAATEYYSQCFAGNQLVNYAYPLGDEHCVYFQGSSGQDFGGYWAMDLYKLRPTAPATKFADEEYTYVGCYTDSGERRTLANGLGSSNWDVATCLSLAKAAGFSIAGVEYGGEWGANEISAPGAPQSADHCTKLCNNDDQYTCGGESWSIDVYATKDASLTPVAAPVTPTEPTTPTTPTEPSAPAVPAPVTTNSEWTFNGCFADGDVRTLSNGLGSTTWTATHCLELAGNAGYKYAGVEYGGEWAANTIVNPQESSACNMACNDNSGDVLERCGGSFAIDVYENKNYVAPAPVEPVTPVALTKYESATWGYRGCFADSTGARTLPNAVGAEHWKTEDCLAAAQDAGFNWAGVEYGGECWAGDASPEEEIDADKCFMACNDLSTESCGGPDALDVYELTPIRVPTPVLISGSSENGSTEK